MNGAESRPENHVFSNVTWLDCTLRDGGYYNAWDFPPEVIQNYLYSMTECGATHIELGFRSLDKNGYRGPTAFTTDHFLDTLEISPQLSIGVMVNTEELTGFGDEPHVALAQLFPGGVTEKIGFVRLATHLEDIEIALKAAKWLKRKGYVVGVNLMQVSEAPLSQLVEISGRINLETVDVLYLADSLGVLSPAMVTDIVKSLAQIGGIDLGFHAHDNRGLALANSLAAIEAGARWVDSTITGMGRGAGNTRSELLIGHLSQFWTESPNTERLEILIENYFQPLQQAVRWGSNVHYVRAAERGIHPTFVQEMLASASYSGLEISAAIDALAAKTSNKFSHGGLDAAESWIQTAASPVSEWNQSDYFQGAKVLLIGSGSTVASHKAALEHLASDISVKAVSANYPSAIDPNIIDACVACHPLRLMAEADLYLRSANQLIAPRNLIPATLAKTLSDTRRLYDIGFEISEGHSVAQPGIIKMRRPLVLPFALQVVLSGGATEVLLAGFDGYQESDPRRALEQAMVSEVLSQYPGRSVRAITPTEFDLPQSSVYGLGG